MASGDGFNVFVATVAETQDIGKWVAELLVKHTPRVRIHMTQLEPLTALRDEVNQTLSGVSIPAPKAHLIAVYYDGTSPESRQGFLVMKKWASEVGISIQALNGKRGAHTLFQNEDAVVSSVTKFVKAAPDSAGGESQNSSMASTRHVDPTSGSTPNASMTANDSVGTKDDAFDEITAARIAVRVKEGQGEGSWVVKAKSKQEFESKLQTLMAEVKREGYGIFPLAEEPKKNDNGIVQEFMIRRDDEHAHVEMRLAMCGNVDSGKSTLTSVLTRGFKDDGRGLARAKVFNHKHEADTGRTSSISENHLGFTADGAVANYPEGGPINPKHSVSSQELSSRSSKIVTLYDLAGHERYLKTTVLGMTRNLPDYACIVISANNGIQRMTKEHLGLCLALKLPFFVVVTRVDSTPDNIQTQTNQTIVKLLKLPTVKKLPFPVKTDEDVIVAAKNLKADRIAPIFHVSNVTGQGIPAITKFINLLPVRKDWSAQSQLPREMVIDSTFFVPGVGTVVGGIITQGTFHPNDTLLLGPDANGAFRQAQVKSIHVKGVDVPSVTAGNDASLCLKKERRNAIRKGNVLADASLAPKAYWQFEAEIVILYHSTTISANYEPVIHSQTARQSARILLVNQEVLRTGDRAIVRFHFLYRPEYLKIGQRLVFREGRTKGIGTVTSLISDVTEGVTQQCRNQAKDQIRQKHESPHEKSKKGR